MRESRCLLKCLDTTTRFCFTHTWMGGWRQNAATKLFGGPPKCPKKQDLGEEISFEQLFGSGLVVFKKNLQFNGRVQASSSMAESPHGSTAGSHNLSRAKGQATRPPRPQRPWSPGALECDARRVWGICWRSGTRSSRSCPALAVTGRSCACASRTWRRGATGRQTVANFGGSEPSRSRNPPFEGF